MIEATRERLVKLWERVPETQPPRLFYDEDGFGIHDQHGYDWEYPDDMAECTAVGKLCEWLVSKEIQPAIYGGANGVTVFTPGQFEGLKKIGTGPTLLEALLQAADAAGKELKC